VRYELDFYILFWVLESLKDFSYAMQDTSIDVEVAVYHCMYVCMCANR
jgi:hypothetical protein